MTEIQHPLWKDVLALQISTVDLLLAMFSPSEIDIANEVKLQLDVIRDWCEAENVEMKTQLPNNITFVSSVDISGAPGAIEVNITVPLCSLETELMEPPPLKYFLRQPVWMSKADVVDLSASMPQGDVFSAVEYIQENGYKFVRSVNETLNKNTIVEKGPIVRVWYYFPSLSTREKRDDMVNHAPGYELTGFVLAGKPGMLCLEGASINIDKYMNFIKTHSWSDIPSYQKKVSERYREEGGKNGLRSDEQIQRVFEGMQEITESLGDRGGKRANRGDMKALELWLQEKGLGDAFAKVIM
ncbi:hypothetical protein EJ08DRAFT_174040 [Tothia fuscella]|uniref:Small nuclear ribonucleoprotein Prp3 C-terminal domain-containing protein n=1 Tax=Tothia fuscella TaxID=1048955 RepID=A0A9P4NU32_9PEZI|nr:hypothetical protein EJ08DRAFT_174040 [Tothia fuscella]